MTTTTILLLNGILATGLLAALAVVTAKAHRVTGSRSIRAARWSQPLELEVAQPVRPELDRAA
ncbi:MAG: hypothetical protein ACXVRE_03805 [Gaiellaceae bacterium]